MVNLNGKNLGERLKDYNLKIIEAAKNKIDLKEVKCAADSDIDRIFKIDLASRYKNVDYLFEELKSGDSLYITKVLKCEWLYDNNYAHLVNPDYLHNNVFPKMSLKMKTKTLSMIYNYMRDEKRVQLFYDYCLNTKNLSQSLKFLLFTSESFKNELMKDDSKFNDLYGQVNCQYFKKFIGNSFTLADTYGGRGKPITDLSYLYSLDEEKYLDLLEKHYGTPIRWKKYGVKMSRSISKKYKDRILRKPLLYMAVLNMNELLKNSTSEDAQVYAEALLPDHSGLFWSHNYYWEHKEILDLIKTENMYEYLKGMYINKYKTEEFEMTKEFYWSKYYQFMTSEQRDAWALMHLEKQLGVLPEDDSYKWYEYITFARSFKEIKKLIYVTTCLEKRSAMLKVLVKSAKTQKDMKELLDYYYKRHVNETRYKKTDFVMKIMEYHEVLEFDDSCWCAFDLILHSLDIYNPLKYSGYDDLLTASMVYHILNNKTLSDGMLTYFRKDWCVRFINKYLIKLTDEKKDKVYIYMTEHLLKIISTFESQKYDSALRDVLHPLLWKFESLRVAFDKEEPYPEIVINYMKMDLENFEHVISYEKNKIKKTLEITEGYLMRCLKEDASLVVEKLPLIKDKMNDFRKFRIHLVLRKIALYFSNDIAIQFLEFYKNALYESLPDNAAAEYRVIYSIVFAIFRMRDEKLKSELMDKFAPANPKIEHDKIGHYVLYTQQAICKFHGYSRPPVSLSKTALYLQGDYVQHCDNIFNMYQANLAPAQRADFIKILLDNPLSIQKRGIRLAFQNCEAFELKNLVSNVWQKTKNVSLRQILYLLLRDKIEKEEGKSQEVFFELLLELTQTIHQDDVVEVFACFTDNRIPEKFRGLYLQTAWKVVEALPENNSKHQRKTEVIKSLEINMSLMDEEFLANIINEHVQKILFEQKLCPEENYYIGELNSAKWELTAGYIVDLPNETKQEKCMKLVKTVTNKCLEHWNEDHNTQYLIFQAFFKKILDMILQHSSYFSVKYLGLINIFEYILATFENKFGIPQIYSFSWDWKLDIIMRKVINGNALSGKEINVKFGQELGLFIKELKDNKLYYVYFFDQIFDKISNHINHLDSNRDESLDYVDVHIFVAYGLTLTEVFEAYVLALKILPENPNEVIRNEYLEVLKKIKEQNNDQLNALLSNKFIYRDLSVRKFLL